MVTGNPSLNYNFLGTVQSMKLINLNKYWLTLITGTHDASEFVRGIDAATRMKIIYEFEEKINYTDAFKETLKILVENKDMYELANNLYIDLAGAIVIETRRYATTLVVFHLARLGIKGEFNEKDFEFGVDVFQRLFEHEIEPPFTEIEIPKEFECSRCGYCCKHFGAELHFQEDDIEMWFNKGLSWVYYHPFIDWRLQEFLAPNNGGNAYNVKEARKRLAEKELEYENDMREEFKELDIDEDSFFKPEPFPWGGTMRYCTFLKWMGNKWGCVIHEYKTKTCREYLCYWDRVEAFFSSERRYNMINYSFLEPTFS